MNCYICEKTPKPGGVRYGIRPAVGVCHHCGIGICVEHSHKSEELGAPLLCEVCAELVAHHPEVYSIHKEVGDLQPT